MFSYKKNKERIINYQRTFATEPGKKVLQDLMIECHVLGPSFSKDALTMAFNEGEKNVALRILKILHINVEQMEEHMKEIENERTDD